MTLQDYIRTSVPDRFNVVMRIRGLQCGGLYDISKVTDDTIVLVTPTSKITIETKYIENLTYTSGGFLFNISDISFRIR